MLETNGDFFDKVTYGDPHDESGVLLFAPRCPHCGRFVKPDDSCAFNGRGPTVENATCRRCGRIFMPFEGFF